MDKKEINSLTLTVNFLIRVCGAEGFTTPPYSWFISRGRLSELEIDSEGLMLNGLAGTPPNWKVAKVDAR